MAGSLGKKEVLNGDIYRNLLKRLWLSAFCFNPLEGLQPLCWYLPVMKTSVHLPFWVSQLWKQEWEGMLTWDVQGKLPMQFGDGSAACLFWCVRTLVFSCVSTLVPILWAQNCKCSCLPMPLQSVDMSGDIRYRCSQIAAAQWKQLQIQVIAHGFKGRFTSLKRGY